MVKRRRNKKKIIIRNISLILVGSMIGIASYKLASDKCCVPASHKHLYINKEGYCCYLESEKDKVNEFYKQSDFKLSFSEDKELDERLLENGFVKIEDNLDLIHYYEQNNGWEEVVGYDENNEPIIERAGFYGYKYDYSNDYIVKSDPVCFLENIMEEYPYIKIGNLFDMVNVNDLLDNFEGFNFDEFSDDEDDISGNFDEFYFDDEFVKEPYKQDLVVLNKVKTKRM